LKFHLELLIDIKKMKRTNILYESQNMQESFCDSKSNRSCLRKYSIVLFIFFGFSLVAFVPATLKTQVPIYLNPSYSFRERAADLVSRMTIEEKQSQLGNTMPPIPRLGVKKYDVWGEALHGVVGRNDNSGMKATSFPTVLQQDAPGILN